MGVLSWLSQFVVTFDLNGSKASVDYQKLDDQRLLITTNYENGETFETIAYVMPNDEEEFGEPVSKSSRDQAAA